MSSVRSRSPAPVFAPPELRLASHVVTKTVRRSLGEGGRRGDCVTLKVKVDRDKCQGHARCAALAPELFELDELGNAREKGDGTVPDTLVEKAYLAKANCPEEAIEVEEKA
jgi:ferredoxin